MSYPVSVFFFYSIGDPVDLPLLTQSVTARRSSAHLVTPQPADTLVVDLPTGPAQLLRGASPSPPGPPLRERPQELAQLRFIPRNDRRFEPLGGAVLADYPTCSPFGDPEPVAKHHDSCTLAVRGQKFPSTRSLSIS